MFRFHISVLWSAFCAEPREKPVPAWRERVLGFGLGLNRRLRTDRWAGGAAGRRSHLELLPQPVRMVAEELARFTRLVEASIFAEVARAHAGEARRVHPAGRLCEENARVDRACMVRVADDERSRLEEGAYRRAKVGAKQAPVEFEACRVEIDIDIRVQHQVEMAQREDPPLEQRAVLEV